VVLIVIDSLRADALGCYGAKAGVSPNLDRMAGEGLRFERAIAQASWNMPSISSLVTSVYPSQHGQGAQGVASGETTTLAEILSGQGYRTGAFSEVSWPLLQRGFESFTNSAGPNLYGDPQASNAATTFTAARDWIRAGDRRPFFAFIHTYEVHSYFMAKPAVRAFAKREHPSYGGHFASWAICDTDTPVGPRVIDALLGANGDDQAYVQSLYRGALAEVDGEVDRLRAALVESHLDENTILIVTSSNGEGFRPDLKRVHHGGRLHDDQLHIPLILRWPARVEPGVVRTLVESIDVAPTILALTGQSPDARLKGQPLVAATTGFWARLRGPRFAPLADGKRTAFAEESAMRVAASGKREAATTRATALYSGWVEIIDSGNGVELFDLKADPAEEKDAAGAHAEAVTALRADLARRASGTAVATGSGSEVNDQLRSLGYVQ
jgi:arylsulfatase A-like enzyme